MASLIKMPDGSSTAHIYRPKLATVFDEGYSATALRKDAVAALTVAIVALPLSMAIAVSSGVAPERGLYSAIVGGFLVSALGGSRYQIGGPAGAFIVLVSATVASKGLEGLLAIVLISGAMLAIIGMLRLGSLIRFIPHSVAVGFTCGIAIIILASQLRDLGGLMLPNGEPGPLLPKIIAVLYALPTINPTSCVVGLGTVTTIFVLARWKPMLPAMLIAVLAASLAAALLQLPIETIGSRFGGIPDKLPTPRLPEIGASQLWDLLPVAASFTLLGAAESLLSAKVADGMTGRKHRYNMELVAQGIANMGSALFGGISVTGTIARTATNIRAGARSPISGILHALFLLAFMLMAAPLARFIPLSALAGVLVVVSWNMAEKAEFITLLRQWRTGAVLLTTFGLTLALDLITGIVAGCLLAGCFAVFGRLRSRSGMTP